MSLCVNQKAYVYIGIVISSLICFILVEMRVKKQEMQQKSIKRTSKTNLGIVEINKNLKDDDDL